MKRAHAVKMAGHWDSSSAVDQVPLDVLGRRARDGYDAGPIGRVGGSQDGKTKLA